MRMRLSVVLLSFLVGCGGGASGKSGPESEYHKAVRFYLEEARVTIQALSTNPTARKVREKKQQLDDLYTKIPEVPKGAKVSEFRDKIRDSMNTAVESFQNANKQKLQESLSEIARNLALAEAELQKSARK